VKRGLNCTDEDDAIDPSERRPVESATVVAEDLNEVEKEVVIGCGGVRVLLTRVLLRVSPPV
jgi:hypothetical protein